MWRSNCRSPFASRMLQVRMSSIVVLLVSDGYASLFVSIDVAKHQSQTVRPPRWRAHGCRRRDVFCPKPAVERSLLTTPRSMAKVVANDRLGVNTDLKSLIKFTVLMVAISLPGGCGIGEATAPNADGAGSQQTTAKAWEQEGSRLRNAKLAARHAAGTSTGVAAENLDDYVYRSAPINIEGAGTYILKFGPVSSEFNWPTRPAALAFSLGYSRRGGGRGFWGCWDVGRCS